jgi:hypothetical protein
MMTFTLMIISCQIYFKMRNISHKSCRENQNTYFTFNNFFYKNHAIYDIMWKNMVEPDRPRMTVKYGPVCCACWITRATDTLSEYVILSTFHVSSGCVNVPQCCCICTLLCLLTHSLPKSTIVDLIIHA